MPDAGIMILSRQRCHSSAEVASLHYYAVHKSQQCMHTRAIKREAGSHQLWCKLSIQLHSQCNVCEGSQGQYRDFPGVGSDHVSNEGGSWCLYCYALQSQFMHSP